VEIDAEKAMDRPGGELLRPPHHVAQRPRRPARNASGQWRHATCCE